MVIDKIMVCSATPKNDEKETLLYKSMEEVGEPCDLRFARGNKEHICKVYNKFLEMAKEEDVDALVLVHDDVIIEGNIRHKLEKLFEIYDVVGVAGTSTAEFKEPALWHLMGGGFKSGNLHGAVAHITGDKKIMTSFGPYPHRVVMIDGVFMAFNKNWIQNSGGFDENIPSKFHFYDLVTSFDSYLNGFKIGVGDIMITHASPGLRAFTDEWAAGEKYFLENYG